ncbi:MAG: TspO/MBR family protein [Methanomicrobiaceae archaeon]|nr:TspO/MBR family protein [Methanomicrobiaceae archaeon]
MCAHYLPKRPGLLLAAVLLCNAAGFLGSLVTVTGPGSWYALLEKPSFNPPSWVFAPVWTTLFVLMGISLYLVLMERSRGDEVRDRVVRWGILLFAGQLVLNTLWSFAFFYLQSPLLGLVDIGLLWVVLLATILVFWKITRPAAVLLIPYIVWVSFATVLNYSIFLLNP